MLGMAAAVLAGVGGGQAMATDDFDTDCHALKLKRADAFRSGFKNFRKYEFEGTCNLVLRKKNGPSVIRTFPVGAKVLWDIGGQYLIEDFWTLGTFKGPYTWTLGGKVHSEYRCNEDPIVVTKGVACTGVVHQNDSGIEPLSNPFKKLYRPITRGKTTLAEATALSGGSIR
jgi:hypothetical protein